MVIAALLDIGANGTRFASLATAMEARGVNFLIGAGLSVPCGMKSWTAFLQQLSRRAYIESAVNALLADGKYEDAAELAYAALEPRAFEEELGASFGPAEIPPERIRGPIIYLPELLSLSDSRFVVTTNFDRAVEAAFRIKGIEFADKIFGAHPERIREGFASGTLCLLKLHGDALDPIGRVLRKTEYAAAYGGLDEEAVDAARPLPSVLFSVFHNRSLLFLGCSLHRDRTMAMLQSIATHWPAAPRHYAVLEDVSPSERDRAERDGRLLNQYNIAAIWYPRGQYEAVDGLLRELIKRVSGHMARGLRPQWAAFAFGLICNDDALDRDDLCEADFAEGWAIQPRKLRPLIDAILTTKSPERKHVAVSGRPGSGKSALAAWIDYSLCERGKLCAYFEGKRYQRTGDLPTDVAKLPRDSIAILDDVHLIRSQVEALRHTSAATDLCLVLFGRPAIFQELAEKLPPFRLFELSEKDGAEVAGQLAKRYCRGQRLRKLLDATQRDLVYTKWLLRGERRGMAPTTDIVARAARELEEVRDAYGDEVLRTFFLLSCFRALELPCQPRHLVEDFGCDADSVYQLSAHIREAVLDEDGILTLQRHPKLAALFAHAVDQMRLGREFVFSPLCRNLQIAIKAVEGFASWSLVLGTLVAKKRIRMADLVDRLIYGAMEASYDEVAFVAAEFELKVSGHDAYDRRVELAAAAANGMRRVSGGEAARSLLRSIRERLGLEVTPDSPFRQKGYALYQEAYLAWLNNDIRAASRIFEDSANADEQFADAASERSTLAYHRAKALMSRIVATRMMVETLASTSPDGGELMLDALALAQYVAQLEAASITLDGLETEVGAADSANVRRFRWNALIHAAQTHAWLGNKDRMWKAIRSARRIDLDLDRDRTLGERLARGQLAYVLGRYSNTVSLLRKTPQIMLREKAGETSGLRAQLLARSYSKLENRQQFETWCRWPIEECPHDAGNGPAIEWARAAIKGVY